MKKEKIVNKRLNLNLAVNKASGNLITPPPSLSETVLVPLFNVFSYDAVGVTPSKILKNALRRHMYILKLLLRR